MGVVSAGVHPAGVLRCKGKICRLLDGQRVHIAAKSGGFGQPRVKIGQNAVSGDRLYLRVQRRKLPEHICLRFGQVKPHLGDAVQGAPVAADGFEHGPSSKIFLFVILAWQH